MECMMRKGGLGENTQNGSNQNKVRWTTLKPWTVKYTDISEWQHSTTLWPFCATDRQCRTGTIRHKWGVPTHFSSKYCSSYYILYLMYQKKRALFTSTLDLKLRKKLVKWYIWSTALYGAEIWTIFCSRSETPGKFSNVVLEKDGEDQLDRSCEKWRSVT